MVLRHFRPSDGGRCLCGNRRLELVLPIVTVFIPPLLLDTPCALLLALASAWSLFFWSFVAKLEFCVEKISKKRAYCHLQVHLTVTFLALFFGDNNMAISAFPGAFFGHVCLATLELAHN